MTTLQEPPSSAASRRFARLRDEAAHRVRSRGGELPGVVEASLLLAMALRRTLGRPAARLLAAADRLAPWLGLLLLGRLYFRANGRLPTRPRSLTEGDGWWGWYDQQKTLQAVLGFHRHHADVANQWYQPLYPFLGALAMHLTPRQPFLWPDLLGLAASFLLFVPLARAMGTSRLLAVLVFLLVNLGEWAVLDNWVIPWNTTPTTPLILLGLLAAARMVRGAAGPDRARLTWPFWFGTAVGLVPAFRPTDLLTLLPAGLVVLASLALPPRRRPMELVRMGAVAVAGFAVGFGLFLAVYLPIFGPHPSPYMEMSRQIGFEWRLLPLHWVTLVVGPRPLFPGQAGLIEGFPWLAPCFAGVIALAAAAVLRVPLPEGRRIHVIVLGAMVPYWALYLSYRDLHPPGLWHYNNFHYFAWTFPLLGIYGVRLLRFAGLALRVGWRSGMRTGTRMAVPTLAGLAVVAFGLCWRVQLDPRPGTTPAPRLDLPRRAVLIPGGLPSLRDVLVLSVHDPAARVDFGEHTLEQGGRTFATFQAFRMFSLPGGAMVLPLRPMPHADGVLRLDGVALDPTVEPRLLRQDVVFGLPCWAPRIVRPAACSVLSPLPGPLFPVGHQIDFDSRMEGPFLIPGGWSDHSDGRWTVGYTSSLQFRVPNRSAIGGGVVLEVEGMGFVPRGSDFLAMDVSANGRRLTRWLVSTTREVALRASVPASIIPPDGEVLLTLSALNARRPADALPHSSDRRLLGFKVRAIRMLPWSEHSDESTGSP